MFKKSIYYKIPDNLMTKEFIYVFRKIWGKFDQRNARPASKWIEKKNKKNEKV